MICLGGLSLSSVAVIQGQLSHLQGLILNTLGIYLAFTPMHDAAHGAISGRRPGLRWIDGLVGWSCGFLFFAPFVAFRRLHLRHHSTTNHPRRDPDYWVASAGPIGLLVRCLTIIPHSYRFFLASGGFGGAEHNRERSQAIAVLGFLIALLCLLVGSGYTQLFLVLWGVPTLLASGFLAFSFDWLPHHPHRSRARFKDTRLVSGWGLHWLLLAQDLHLIHHLHPRVPFYRYRRLYKRLGPELDAQRVQTRHVWPGGH